MNGTCRGCYHELPVAQELCNGDPGVPACLFGLASWHSDQEVVAWLQVVKPDGSLAYSPVYLFPHFQTTGAHTFMQLTTETNSTVGYGSGLESNIRLRTLHIPPPDIELCSE